MAKPKTIIENGIYHITQRAPGNELLFLEENDYLYFLKLLKAISCSFKIEVFCFALLPNHIHILLRTEKKNLPEAMKFLFQRYALYFNKKYKRKGHVFCGRYYANLCTDNQYLLTASIYIHLNPFKANLCNNIFSYKWYSLAPYIKNTNKTFLSTKLILFLLNKDIEKAKKSYKEIISNSRDIEHQSTLKNSHAVNNFYRKLTETHQDFLAFFKKNKNKSDWEKLNKQIDEIILKKNISSPSDKKAIAYLIKQLQAQEYSINEISKKLNMHRTTIYRIIKETSF